MRDSWRCVSLSADPLRSHQYHTGGQGAWMWRARSRRPSVASCRAPCPCRAYRRVDSPDPMLSLMRRCRGRIAGSPGHSLAARPASQPWNSTSSSMPRPAADTVRAGRRKTFRERAHTKVGGNEHRAFATIHENRVPATARSRQS